MEFYDPYRELRKDLFGNVEPEIKLEAITIPILEFDKESITVDGCYDDEIGGWQVEMLPAIAASTSYGRREKIDNIKAARKLNKHLIKMDHMTPFESIQFNFFISGISKACGAQLSRYRTGTGHVSASRRFKEAEPRFVYPAFNYIKYEDLVEALLDGAEELNKAAFEKYELMQEEIEMDDDVVVKIKKEDSRMLLPVSYATERSWWVNCRELRHILKQRLASDAEWEIRRLAIMIFNIVCLLLPSIFEDLKNKA